MQNVSGKRGKQDDLHHSASVYCVSMYQVRSLFDENITGCSAEYSQAVYAKNAADLVIA